MRAGTLRHRVIIQSLSESRDSHGGVTRSWSTAATRWASVEPLSGRELIDGQKVESELTHRVRMRMYDGLTTSMRLQHNSRTLNIEHIINPQERDELLEILCKEDDTGTATA